MSIRQRASNWITWGIAFVAVLVWNAPTHAAATQAAFTSPSCRYVVQPGDWLSKIAARYGMAWTTIYTMNRATIGADPNRLDIGMVLSLCGQSASGPPTAAAPAVTYHATGGVFTLPGEMCRSATVTDGTPISAWKVPPGCYANIYVPNPANYPTKPGVGWCNWWPEVLHPSINIFTATLHRAPQLGAAIKFAPGEQGASPIGHWGGEVIWLSGDGQWALISEMNMYWRGGGFAKVSYRYIRITAGTTFIY